MKKDDPIDNIEWRLAAELNPNGWNPNHVFSPELKLLEWSIIQQGWIQPILINPNNLIIDGFHRWKMSTESKTLMQRYGGFVPVAVINVDDAHAKCMTVRINRAKGNHIAIKMNSLVQQLVDDHGLTPKEIANELGMTLDEVELLMQDNVFEAKKIKDWEYSKAWYPVEQLKKG